MINNFPELKKKKWKKKVNQDVQTAYYLYQMDFSFIFFPYHFF